MPLGQIIKVHMHISEVSVTDGFPYELNGGFTSVGKG